MNQKNIPNTRTLIMRFIFETRTECGHYFSYPFKRIFLFKNPCTYSHAGRPSNYNLNLTNSNLGFTMQSSDPENGKTFSCRDRKSLFHTKAQRHEGRPLENILFYLCDLRDLRVRTTFCERINCKLKHYQYRHHGDRPDDVRGQLQLAGGIEHQVNARGKLLVRGPERYDDR